MTWVDRLAIVWAFVLAAGIAAALPAEAIIYGVLMFAGPPWLLLRGLRWVVVGGAR